MLSSFRRPGIAAREDCWCVIMDSGMACCTLWGSMLKLAFWGMSTEVSWVVKFCVLWDTNQLLKKCFPFFWCDLNWYFILNQAKILVSIEFQNLFLKCIQYSYIIEAKNYHFKMYVQEYSQHSCTLLDPSGQRWRKIWWIHFRSNLTVYRCLHLYLFIARTYGYVWRASVVALTFWSVNWRPLKMSCDHATTPETSLDVWNLYKVVTLILHFQNRKPHNWTDINVNQQLLKDTQN